jgi:hypothetical protein
MRIVCLMVKFVHHELYLFETITPTPLLKVAGMKQGAELASAPDGPVHSSCFATDSRTTAPASTPDIFGHRRHRRIVPTIGIGGALRLRPSYTTVRTGPYTAVREVTLTRFDQGWETERFEAGIGESTERALLRARCQGSRPLPAVLRSSPETPSAVVLSCGILPGGWVGGRRNAKLMVIG